MKIIELLVLTGFLSSQVTPLHRLVLFTDDITNILLENIEIIRQHLRELRPRNAEPTTVTGNQVNCTTMDLSSPIEPVANSTGRSLTPINNRRSTFDKEDDEEGMIIKFSRNTVPPQSTASTRRTMSYSNAL